MTAPAIAAVSVAVLRGAKVLLVQRGHGAAIGQWAFPGGRIQSGETEEAAALRELAEETAITARLTGTLARYAVPASPTLGPIDLMVFTASYVAGTARAQDDARAVVWIRPQDALTRDLAVNMADALRRLYHPPERITPVPR